LFEKSQVIGQLAHRRRQVTLQPAVRRPAGKTLQVAAIRQHGVLCEPALRLHIVAKGGQIAVERREKGTRLRSHGAAGARGSDILNIGGATEQVETKSSCMYPIVRAHSKSVGARGGLTVCVCKT